MISQNSFITKYLSFSDEKRIRRLQFIIRFALLFWLSSAIWYFTSPLIQLSASEMSLFEKWLPSEDPVKILLGNVFWFFLYGVGYYMLYIIASKRYHDIGWSSRTPSILVSVFLIINLWSMGLWIYSTYFGNPMLGWWDQNYWVQILWSGIGGLAIGSFIGIIIMSGLCIVLPWFQDENTYGESPKDTRISLIG